MLGCYIKMAYIGKVFFLPGACLAEDVYFLEFGLCVLEILRQPLMSKSVLLF